jgi:hypothetical protein
MYVNVPTDVQEGNLQDLNPKNQNQMKICCAMRQENQNQLNTCLR